MYIRNVTSVLMDLLDNIKIMDLLKIPIISISILQLGLGTLYGFLKLFEVENSVSVTVRLQYKPEQVSLLEGETKKTSNTSLSSSYILKVNLELFTQKLAGLT